MKKLLTKADLNKIAKAYSLNEAEQAELASYAAELNGEQRKGADDCSATHMALFCSIPMAMRGEWAKDLANAATAVMLYLAKRIQQAKLEAGQACRTAMSLEDNSRELAYMVGEYSDNIKWFFVGLWSNPRWGKALYTAHKCGLDTLEIY